MYVSDLDGQSVSGKGKKWDATVTITVADAQQGPVAGATVNASWSDGQSGAVDSCLTDSNGQCSLTTTNLNSQSIIFTVNTVSHASFIYQAGDNIDPDGDSDGTSLTLYGP